MHVKTKCCTIFHIDVPLKTMQFKQTNLFKAWTCRTMSNSLPDFLSARDRTIWVKARLEQLGTSFSAIARAHGWSPQSVAAAMRSPSDPQEKAVAAALGVSQRALFPERFDAEGTRYHAVRNNKASEKSHNVKNKTAA